MTYKRILLVSMLILSGCAGEPLTEDELFERDYKRAMDLENWAACEKAYNDQGRPTWHMDHRHGERDRIRQWMIKKDLIDNNCRAILGKERWAK